MSASQTAPSWRLYARFGSGVVVDSMVKLATSLHFGPRIARAKMYRVPIGANSFAVNRSAMQDNPALAQNRRQCETLPFQNPRPHYPNAGYS